VVVVAHTAHKTEYFAYFLPHISSSMPAVYVVALTGFENLVTFLAVFIYFRPGPITGYNTYNRFNNYSKQKSESTIENLYPINLSLIISRLSNIISN
jgi:hypothetical protein